MTPERPLEPPRQVAPQVELAVRLDALLGERLPLPGEASVRRRRAQVPGPEHVELFLGQGDVEAVPELAVLAVQFAGLADDRAGKTGVGVSH